MQRYLVLLLMLLSFCAACNHAAPSSNAANNGAQRYALKGKVVSVDRQAAAANIENEPIAGFMDSMVMPYTIRPPAMLDQIKPGDSIVADVVVPEPGKYWLENVRVTAHAEPPAAAMRAPSHSEGQK